jgi:GT2 family glycosyltransferase
VSRTGRPAGTEAASVAVIVATRNRRASLLRTLARLHALEERPKLVVVDNASYDGTPAAVRDAFPAVDVIALEENVGPVARTIGARSVEAPYVAFSDDDSWWSGGALARAVTHLDRFPALALVAAHVVVGDSERDDETALAMRESPLGPQDGLPGPPVLGFLACGCVVRRSAFLAVGGFRGRFTGSEETLLAVDLAAAGWRLAYVSDVVAHHDPPGGSPSAERRRGDAWNALWFAWTRRPARTALVRTAALARTALADDAVRRALADVVRDARAISRERRVVDGELEAALRRLGV